VIGRSHITYSHIVTSCPKSCSGDDCTI